MSKKAYLRIVISALAVLFGIGLMLYPKSTDMKYSHSQASTATTGKNTKASEAGSGEQISIPEDAIGTLFIPRIDLEAGVFPGTSQKLLAKGPGHYEETPLPGEKGNCAIAGHRTMHGHPFRHLDQLEKGDEIMIYTADAKFTYSVIEQKVVKPTDLSVIAPTEEAMLTLTACHPVGSARQRLVIVAQLVEE